MKLDAEQTKQVKKIVSDIVAEIIINRHNLPAAIIQRRHIGEGVNSVRAGLTANKPTSGDYAGAVYFSTDNDTLSIWNGTAWVDEVLT